MTHILYVLLAALVVTFSSLCTAQTVFDGSSKKQRCQAVDRLTDEIMVVYRAFSDRETTHNELAENLAPFMLSDKYSEIIGRTPEEMNLGDKKKLAKLLRSCDKRRYRLLAEYYKGENRIVSGIWFEQIKAARLALRMDKAEQRRKQELAKNLERFHNQLVTRMGGQAALTEVEEKLGFKLKHFGTRRGPYPRIESLEPEGFAARAGLEVDDLLLEVNSASLQNVTDPIRSAAPDIFQANHSGSIDFTVCRWREPAEYELAYGRRSKGKCGYERKVSVKVDGLTRDTPLPLEMIVDASRTHLELAGSSPYKVRVRDAQVFQNKLYPYAFSIVKAKGVSTREAVFSFHERALLYLKSEGLCRRIEQGCLIEVADSNHTIVDRVGVFDNALFYRIRSPSDLQEIVEARAIAKNHGGSIIGVKVADINAFVYGYSLARGDLDMLSASNSDAELVLLSYYFSIAFGQQCASSIRSVDRVTIARSISISVDNVVTDEKSYPYLVDGQIVDALLHVARFISEPDWKRIDMQSGIMEGQLSDAQPNRKEIIPSPYYDVARQMLSHYRRRSGCEGKSVSEMRKAFATILRSVESSRRLSPGWWEPARSVRAPKLNEPQLSETAVKAFTSHARVF